MSFSHTHTHTTELSHMRRLCPLMPRSWFCADAAPGAVGDLEHKLHHGAIVMRSAAQQENVERFHSSLFQSAGFYSPQNKCGFARSRFLSSVLYVSQRSGSATTWGDKEGQASAAFSTFHLCPFFSLLLSDIYCCFSYILLWCFVVVSSPPLTVSLQLLFYVYWC